MRHFSFSERGPGDWDVVDRSRLFAIRTEPTTGKVYLRDERPGHTKDKPREYASMADVVAAVTGLLMGPETEDAEDDARALPAGFR